MSTLKELLPTTLAMHQHDHAASIAQVQYLMARRDSIADKIRFGLIALNGASLLALISALGGSGAAASWLGFTASSALSSAIAFTLGLGLAGYAVTRTQRLLINEAGDANSRTLKISALVAMYESADTQPNRDELRKLFDEHAALPLVGFRYSGMEIWARNLSAGAWFIGISTPLINKVAPSWAAVGAWFGL